LAVALTWPYLLAGIKSSGLGFGYFARGLKPLKWVVLAGVVMHAVSTPGTPVWPTPLWGVEWTLEGTFNGVRVMGQLATAVAFATLLTLTTAPVELVWALGRLLSPLKKIGIPIEEFFLSVMLALGFFPILAEELDTIVSKKKVRGKLAAAELLIGRMLGRAESLEAELLEQAKGYAPGEFEPIDWGVLAGSVLTVWVVLTIGGTGA
jgi:energy-coupling factor transport system permease protein